MAAHASSVAARAIEPLSSAARVVTGRLEPKVIRPWLRAAALVAVVGLFAGLALYQLPDTRLSVGGGRVPYFAGFLVLLIAIALFRVREGWREPDISVPILLLSLLAVATLLTGAAHQHQDWLEASKRLVYLAGGVAFGIAASAWPSRLLRPALTSMVGIVGVMAFYGFFLLGSGFGESLVLLYWGLHYTPATRNGDSFFLLIPAFASAYLAMESGNRWVRLGAVAAGTGCLAAIVYSYSRGTWIGAGIGIILFLLLARDRRAWAGAAFLGVLIALLMLVPVRNHHPLADFFARAATITDVRTRSTQILPFAGVASPVAAGSSALSAAPTTAPSPLIIATPSAAPPTYVPPPPDSNAERISLLGAAVSIIRSHPLLGLGVGGLEFVPGGGRFKIGTLENAYLTAWAEYGVLGILAVVALVAWPIYRLRRVRDLPRLALLAGVVAFAANCLTYAPLTSAWFWVLPLALATAGHRAGQTTSQTAD